MSNKLRTYLVSGYLTISVTAEIKAHSKKEARECAADLSVPSLCHQCARAGNSDDGCWELNGFDDPPEDAVQDIEEIE